jgi:hypothetical protein
MVMHYFRTDCVKTIRIAFLLVLLSHAAVQASGDVDILPTPTSDSTFQFLKLGKAFAGTPLEVDALVPNALFVIGDSESPALFIQVANMAYMIGSWAHDPGASVEEVRQNLNLPPVVLEKDLSPERIKNYNLVVVGKENSLYKQLKRRLHGNGSFIEVVEDAFSPDRDVMVVSDEKAAFYLANKRLYLKSGTYSDFFNMVKTRFLIEKEDFNDAMFSLDNPDAVAGWGKTTILALGHKSEVPIMMMLIARKKNKLLYEDLMNALKERDKEKSIRIWQEAMETCYKCHHVKKYRKFTPNQAVHSYHHVIVRRFDFECTTCHKGKTAIRGYR